MNSMYKKNIFTAAIIVVVLFVSMLLSINAFFKLDNNIYDNDIRLLVAEQKNNIENGIYTKGRFPYIVFGLDG